MAPRIYLDHAATTPVAQPVLEAMLPYFSEHFGNASSRSHSFGWNAAAAVEEASKQLAALLDVYPEEITFTSGSTEAINLAIKGVAERYSGKGKHIITSSAEHSAVLDTCKELERKGFTVDYLRPGESGQVVPEAVEAAVKSDTILCALMWANNETGVINDMKAIGAVCAHHKILFFSDATQAVGKMEVHPKEMGIQLLACSAHKFYGPKGIGALWINDERPKISLIAQQHGGGHQNGLRSGTLNVPGIVGMGAAAVLAKAEYLAIGNRLETFRNQLESTLKFNLNPVLINGHQAPRLSHITNISIRFTEAEALLSGLNRRVALSTGSACASAELSPSHVLLAMGLNEQDAKSAIRISMGRTTTIEEVEEAAKLICFSAQNLRKESPAYELFQDGIIS